MNSISLYATKPTQVGKPEAGSFAMNSGAIVAPAQKFVALVTVEADLIDEHFFDRGRLARLQARAARAGLDLAECLTGFVIAGQGVRRYCGDLAIVARALGEIGEVSHG